MNTPFFIQLNKRLVDVKTRLAIINANRHGPVPETDKLNEDSSHLAGLCETTANLLSEIEVEVDRLYSSHALGQEVTARGHS